VIQQQPIEQHLVGILQGPQVNVPLQVVVLVLTRLKGARGLSVRLSICGGNRPCKPRSLRSSSVNAVPLFNMGKFRRLAPRSRSAGVDRAGRWSVFIVQFLSA
jgi:hypothetical protein